MAKLLQPIAADAATESLSQTRGAVGTLPYMAPEQLQGEAADARSDLWAAGAVLYEMATGRRPFPQTSSPMLTDAILRQVPVPLRGINANLSPELERIITKSLEKDPEHRYQSAKEVSVDLRRMGMSGSVSPIPAAAAPRKPSRRVALGLTGGLVLLVLATVSVWQRMRPPSRTGPPHIESLAVLPLENLSGDPQQDYFADGMTEELIAELAHIRALRVVSRTSVMQYKGARKPLPEIARELNVDAVVEGSVMRSGDRVRVTAQLIHTPTDQHLWAESYERDLRDVLTLQREVARTIAGEVRATLTPEERTRFATAKPIKPQAHEFYLKGRYFWNQRTREGFRKAIEYFNQAIEEDPDYALAYAGLADSYNLLARYGFAEPKEAYPKARAAAARALEIDDTLSEAQSSLAYTRWFYDWDRDGAEKEFQRAVNSGPNYATAHHWYALFLVSTGRRDEAMVEMKRAQSLDPLSLIINSNLGRLFYYSRQYDRAIDQYRKTLELDPNFVEAHLRLGQALVRKSMFSEAIAEFRRTIALSGGSAGWGGLGYTYAKAGRKLEAQEVLSELTQRSKRQYTPSYEVALVYVGLGDKGHAMQWLQNAYEEHEPLVVYLGIDGDFDPLRSDPRFQQLVRRIGLRPEDSPAAPAVSGASKTSPSK